MQNDEKWEGVLKTPIEQDQTRSTLTIWGFKVTNFLQYVLQTGKKFVYVEPPKRVKEVLEEELYFRRDGCQIKHPAAVALEGIWSVKRNFSVRGLTPASQNRNSLLSQPKYYSRHGGIRSKTIISRFQL
uniref:Chromosome 11 open reading frame 97 n=1 Tax=Gopherus evgoodei TaxID=1825980 RepID=A0A8C4W3W6_9SAUR